MARLPFSEVPQWLPAAFQEVFGVLARQGVQRSGMPFARYVIHQDAIELEAGAPVEQPVMAEGRVVPCSLPAGPAASTVHVGPYDGLEAAVVALAEWIVARSRTGRRALGDLPFRPGSGAGSEHVAHRGRAPLARQDWRAV